MSKFNLDLQLLIVSNLKAIATRCRARICTVQLGPWCCTVFVSEKKCVPRKYTQNPRIKYFLTQCKFFRISVSQYHISWGRTSVCLWSINSYLKASKQTNKQKFWSFLTLQKFTLLNFRDLRWRLDDYAITMQSLEIQLLRKLGNI